MEVIFINQNNSSENENLVSKDTDIISEEIKTNFQVGRGEYSEVRYKDGGCRQYDVETGELIGSSYSSDQKYLPNLE